MIAWLAGQLFAFVTSSNSASCPPAWSVGQVRPDGLYRCELVNGSDDLDTAPLAYRIGHVYCRAGEQPINLDSHRVTCVRVQS